jgi:DNA polymerase V
MMSAALATNREPDDDIYRRPLFLSSVQAGRPSPADDTVEERINLNQFIFRNPGATTIYRVRDDALQEFDVFEGDLLVIDRSLAPEGGKLALVEMDGEEMVGLLVRLQGKLFLTGGADAGSGVEFREGEGLKLLGVVTHSIHTLDE